MIVKNELINMTQQRKKKKIWVPDRNQTHSRVMLISSLFALIVFSFLFLVQGYSYFFRTSVISLKSTII